MTLAEIKNLAMFQYNMEPGDEAEYTPFLIAYINEGYDRFVRAWTGERHAGGTDYPLLTADGDVPRIPERYHKPLTDWATWCLYRNGNSAKQQRGYEYRRSFEEALAAMIADGGEKGDLSGDADGDGLDDETGEPVPAQPYRQFYNIPR
jgi:hypothetical protein